MELTAQEALSILQSTFEAASEGILAIDSAGKILTCNTRCRKMWKIPDAVLKTRDRDKVLIQMAEQVKDREGFLWASRAVSEDFESERHDDLELKDGRIIERYSRPQTLNGAAVGRVFCYRDVTEQRKTRESLLRQAQELIRSNTELEHFAMVASHDLEGPMELVSRDVREIMRKLEDYADPTVGDLLAGISASITRMQAYVKSLLLYSRVGVPGKKFRPINCADIVAAALENLKSEITQNRAKVTHDLLPMVMGRSAEILQLFQNLIANALKYRGKEDPVIHISSAIQGETRLISAKDNGIGIDPKYAEEIFKPFQRINPDAYAAGTGIGLALCKKVVEGHGGRI